MRRRPLVSFRLGTPFCPGDVVFHGVGAEYMPDELPAFYTTSKVLFVSDEKAAALWYADRWQEPDQFVMSFEIKQSPRLLLMGDFDDLRALSDELGVPEHTYAYGNPMELADLLCDRGDYDGWHIREGDGGGSDTAICRPAQFLRLVSVERVREGLP